MFMRPCITPAGSRSTVSLILSKSTSSYDNDHSDQEGTPGKRVVPRVDLKRDKIKGKVISWNNTPKKEVVKEDVLQGFRVKFGSEESSPDNNVIPEMERNEALSDTRSEILQELDSLRSLARHHGRNIKNSNASKRPVPDSCDDFFNVKSLFTLRDLFESRVHLGHHIGCWHAANKPYLYGIRNNMHIIDIASTEQHLWRVLNVISHTVYKGGSVLLVNNKPGYGHIVEEAAKCCSQRHYTNDMPLKSKFEKVDLAWFDQNKPDLVICSSCNNPVSQQLLLHCNKYLVPTIGILDSDVDPVNLTYIIPGNDDSTDSILLYHKLFASSILRAKTADTLISHSNHPGRLGKQAAGGTGAGIVRR